MIKRRTRPAAVVEETKQEAPKPAEPEKKSSGTDYDRIIARYKEKANTPKKAIRAHCIECMGGMIAEVDRCTASSCGLHPYRKGSNPNHKLSKHYKAQMAAQAEAEDGESP